MEPGKSNDYKYYSFDSEHSILYHDVKNENFGDKEAFVINISFLITLIERFKPKGIIVNLYKEPDYFELELTNFMQKALYTTLVNVGIKGVAFYVIDQKYLSELKAYESENPIKVRFFPDLKMSREWLMSLFDS